MHLSEVVCGVQVNASRRLRNERKLSSRTEGNATMPTSRTTQWVAREFDRRAGTYDESRQHVWEADRAAQLLNPQPDNESLTSPPALA